MSTEESTVEFTEVLRALNAEKFADVLSASSRKARETYFHRHGVRAPSGGGFNRPGKKNALRTAKLYEVLREADDDEMAEEVLRTWLLTKRQMLVAALDHLGIEHQDGLTESEEVAKFEKLSARDIKALAGKLESLADRDDIRVYLKFMGTKDVDKALG